jgi:multidrug resistance efflux pump
MARKYVVLFEAVRCGDAGDATKGSVITLDDASPDVNRYLQLNAIRPATPDEEDKEKVQIQTSIEAAQAVANAAASNAAALAAENAELKKKLAEAEAAKAATKPPETKK